MDKTINGIKYREKRLRLAERRQRIKDAYIPGVSLADLAERFGISRARVWQVIHGYERKPRRKA